MSNPGPSHSGSGRTSSPSPSALLTSPTSLPTSKHNLTPHQLQAQALSKLLSNPDKEVKLPGPPKEKTLRAPREMMKNVSGSSAGAGSGEFHIYKHARRREYERIKLMEDKAKKEEEARDFAARQAALDALSSSKTSKNKAKRDKKKAAIAAARLAAGKKRKNEGGKEEGDGEEGEGEGRGKKRIVADVEGAERMIFKRPGGKVTEEDGDEAEEEE